MTVKYAELELHIEPQDGDTYRVKLQFRMPGTDADTDLLPDIDPVCNIDPTAFLRHTLDDTAYGKELGAQLLSDNDLAEAVRSARRMAHAAGHGLRWRLFIDPGAQALHRLHWEKMILPRDATPLSRSEHTLFSRYLRSPDVKPITTSPALTALRALALAANPQDLVRFGLEPLDVDAELATARESLDPVPTTALGQGQASLDNLLHGLRDGHQIVYLVAHGTIVDGEPQLALEDDLGRLAWVSGQDLAEHLRDLAVRPHLVVLASCHSAGAGEGDVPAALGPLLVRAGVPAVVAMQGTVQVETASQFAETLFTELRRDGVIDRAVAAARVAVRKQSDWWMPVLFMRLRSGRLFAPVGKEDGAAVSVSRGDLIQGNKTVMGDEVHGDKVGTKYEADVIYIDQRVERKDRRTLEEEYLRGVVEDYKAWVFYYTGMKGKAEIRAQTAVDDTPRLPRPLMRRAIMHVRERRQGMEMQVERVEVPDLREAVTTYKRLVLVGDPGSGKTTTLQLLAHDIAHAALGDVHAPLPLFVPLNGYDGPQPALEFVAPFLGELSSHLAKYLETGRVVLLLDALNEMPRVGYKERVARIQDLLDEYPESMALVTCRELDYQEVKLTLDKLEIEPLDIDQRREYLHNYLDETRGDDLFWQLAGGELLRDAWRIWEQNGESWHDFWRGAEIPESVRWWLTADQRELWRELRRPGVTTMLELGANPLLLSMLVDVYDREHEIPQNRGQLFGDFVSGLLADEQGRNPVEQWPGDQAICDGLALLAYTMQMAGERGTTVDAAWIETALPDDVDRLEPLFYLAASATLLDRSGGQVSFVHQLIQEYFAALAWQDKLASDDLSTYWRYGWLDPTGWEETAILLAGMMEDMTLLVQKLIPIHPVLAARCIEASGGKRPDDEVVDAVQTRLEAIATGTDAPAEVRHAAGNGLNILGDGREGVGLRANGLPDIVWCEVLEGAFRMGNTKETDEMAYDYEMPQIEVYLDTFLISKYPVTNAQYGAFVDAGGYRERRYWTDAGWEWRREDLTGPRTYGSDFDQPNHPVVGVNWYEAVAFCNWLSEATGEQITLPSEAQWEKAARSDDGWRYPWGQEITADHANYDTNLGSTSAVGIFPKGVSPCKALDMSGNVLEWCQTTWTESYDDYHNQVSEEAEGTVGRTLRGGSFSGVVDAVRCADRGWVRPDARGEGIGFRVVQSPGR